VRVGDSIPQGENQFIFSDETDGAGLFDIQGIYYYTEVDFKVYATKGDHKFQPDTIDVTLSQIYPTKNLTSPSFVDTSSFTVKGNVAQLLGNDTAYVENVEILVNDIYKGTKTDEHGFFSLTVDEADEYTIKPQFSEHSFTPAEMTMYIESDIDTLFFENIQKDTLSGYFQGGCNINIGQAELRIFNSDNPTAAFDTVITTAEVSGYYEFVLPSREYTIQVLDFSKDTSININEIEVINFFAESEIDLTTNSVQKDFIYRKPPEIEVSGFPELAACIEPYNVPIVEQVVNYPLEIKVFESFGEDRCLTSNGYVVIYDEVKDRYDGSDTIQLEDGIANYDLFPGVPNILEGGLHPYQKKIAFHANVDGQTDDIEQYLLVEGNKPKGDQFTTVSPEIPYIILRDPPGDESYSYMTKNTSFTTNMSMYAQLSNSLNAWAKVKLGAKTLQGFGVFVEQESYVKFNQSLTVGSSLKGQTDMGFEFAVDKTFSTSGNQDITGEDGDVYVGFAMNIIYALTDVIKFDDNSCKVETSKEIIIGNNGFATTFMYTEKHIKNVLIPSLEEIAKIYRDKGSDSASIYRNQISVWKQTLSWNEQLKKNAVFVENRSFSSGAGFETSLTAASNKTLSISYSLFIEQSIGAEVKLELAGNGVEAGVEAKFRAEIGGSGSTGISNSKTVGYSLNDNDLGDNFTVNVKADPVYATPVFELVSGRSSCPWEPGTQSREGVQLLIDKKIQQDIDPDGEAVFRLNLGNTSESSEEHTYNLKFLAESNPDGANVDWIGKNSAAGYPITIPAGSSIDQTITVKRGPNANDYQDLKFSLVSDCDAGQINDEVSFSVYFNSNCSDITISKPANYWLINGGDNNSIEVEVSGYETDKLNNIVLQYKNIKSNAWEIAYILESSELMPNSTTLKWDVTTMEDGEYEIRIKVACGTNNSEFSFSEKVVGSIDRSVPALFGVPEPSDGNYDKGDKISATFDENLNCFNINTDNVIVKDKNSGTIYTADIGCGDNKIIIAPLTEDTFTEQAMEVSLMNIEDLYGNVGTDTIKWKFDIADADFIVEDTTDTDNDGIVDIDDNCPYTLNSDQADRDGDNIGDACDDDIDGDGITNFSDNCPFIDNTDQSDVCNPDMDNDGILNEEDNCPFVSNADQADSDIDGAGDACSPTNIKELTDNNIGLNIYPNPAGDLINIDFQLGNQSKVVMNIFDLNNKLIITVPDDFSHNGNYSNSVNVENLKPGIYFIQIITDDTFYTGKMFVVK